MFTFLEVIVHCRFKSVFQFGWAVGVICYQVVHEENLPVEAVVFGTHFK